MTAQEIKDLIASKIAGQGSAVDAGSALPEILNGIVDAIAAIPEPVSVPNSPLNLSQLGESTLGEYASAEELADALQISEKDLTDLFEGRIPFVILHSGGFYNVSVRKNVAGMDVDEYTNVYFWYIDTGAGNIEQSGYILNKRTNPEPVIYSIYEV